MTSMAAFDLPRLAALGEDEIARFRRDGFLVVERILTEDRIAALRERFPLLFAGRFETGIYPDEWYWREGMSLPDVTRHMGNTWKSDLTVGSVVLSPVLARLVCGLAGWDGARSAPTRSGGSRQAPRSEEHTSELQPRQYL